MNKTVMIERTTKSAKAKFAISYLLFFVGVIGLAMGGGNDSPTISIISGLTVVAGAVTWIVAAVQRWWQND